MLMKLTNLPIMIYKDINWCYIAECPLLQWFHTYWKTYEELEYNIKEVIELYQQMIDHNEIQIDWLEDQLNNMIWINFYHSKNREWVFA